MARVQIGLRDGMEKQRMHLPNAYLILVDGREIEGLTGVSLDWEQGGVPTAHLSFNVSEIDVDTNALVELHARARSAELPVELLERIAGEVLGRIRRAQGEGDPTA